MSVPTATIPPQAVPATPILEPDAQRLSALVDAGPEAVSIVDGEWRYTYVNRAFETMARTSRDKVIGRSMWELYPFLDGTEFSAQLRQVKESRSAARMKYRGEQGGVFDVHVMPFTDGIAFFTYEVTDLQRITE